jgi:hypothetical protein
LVDACTQTSLAERWAVSKTTSDNPDSETEKRTVSSKNDETTDSQHDNDSLVVFGRVSSLEARVADKL